MCGFLYSSFDIPEDLLRVSEDKVIRRGPDHRNVARIDGHTYVHYLLHITGEKTPQPLTDGNCVLVYNGEIYNYGDLGDYASDGYAILDAYKTEGIDGLRKLEGEFAGVIRDEDKLVLFRDTFGTKPMFMAYDQRGIALSSYESQLRKLYFSQIIKIPINSIVVLNIKEQKTDQYVYRDFDLNQTKRDFGDWEAAFYKSIKQRTHNNQVSYFIGLSSGYDSGLISCVLNELEIDYRSYSILAAENEQVLRERGTLAPHNEYIHLTEAEYLKQQRFLEQHCEPYTSPPRATRTNGYNLFKDKGAVGTGIICEKALKAGCKVYISGQGSDEILSDYGHNGIVAPGFLHSTIAGRFPSDLSSVFPWENFFGGTQEEFLTKDENVGGTYGLECRYPFLDYNVVQEFLWLHPDLKNANYKSPIFHTLQKKQYPLAPNGLYGKVGFRANSGFRAT